MEESIFEVLRNLGSLGVALAVIWTIWKKAVEPQQKLTKEATEKHIATLEKMLEEFTKRNEIEKEHLDALRKINGKGDLVSEKIKSHDERMGREHDRLSNEIKAK